MATRPNHSRRKNATPINRTRAEVRTLFYRAFVHAVEKSQLSTDKLARELRVTRKTAQRWKRVAKLDVEALAMSGRIWPTFLRCLFVMERKARVI